MSKEGDSEKDSGQGGGKDEGDKSTGNVVKITNIPAQIDETSLKSVLSYFGKVELCRLVLPEKKTDPATAWVVYSKRKEADSAVKADGKLECGGCKLKIGRWEGDVPSENQYSKRKITESSTCQDSCWFCLSNDQCETHMISYVSKHVRTVSFIDIQCYVAMAKGGLSDMHALVVPIYHYPNMGEAPLDVQMDVKNVVDNLFDIFLGKGMGAISFERYVPMSTKVAMHTQIQVLPIPLEKALKAFDFVDKSEVFEEATRITFDSEDVGYHKLSSKVSNNTQYLYLQAVGKSKESEEKLSYAKCLWVFTKPNSAKIPTHFGREIALSVISSKDLEKITSLRNYVIETNVSPEVGAVDWRNCVVSREEEKDYSNNMTKLILELK